MKKKFRKTQKKFIRKTQDKLKNTKKVSKASKKRTIRINKNKNKNKKRKKRIKKNMKSGGGDEERTSYEKLGHTHAWPEHTSWEKKGVGRLSSQSQPSQLPPSQLPSSQPPPVPSTTAPTANMRRLARAAPPRPLTLHGSPTLVKSRDMTKHELQSEPEPEQGTALPVGWSVKYNGNSGVYYYVNDLSGEIQSERPSEPATTPLSRVDITGSSIDDFKPRVYTGIPKGWIIEIENGELYCVNSFTGEKQQDVPTEPATPLPDGWSFEYDEASKIYYINEHTREMQRERPTEPATMPLSRVDTTGSSISDFNFQDVIEYENDSTEEKQRDVPTEPATEPLSREVSSVSSIADDDKYVSLPSGWKTKRATGSDEIYYVNDLTGESQWDKPTEPATPLPPGWKIVYYDDQLYYENENTESWQKERPTESAPPLPPGWKIIYDPSGNDNNYMNIYTGETQWYVPMHAATGESSIAENPEKTSPSQETQAQQEPQPQPQQEPQAQQEPQPQPQQEPQQEPQPQPQQEPQLQQELQHISTLSQTDMNALEEKDPGRFKSEFDPEVLNILRERKILG